MNTPIHSARRLSILSLFCFGLAVTSLAHAAAPQLAGPRNTIPQKQAQQQSSQPTERLRAATFAGPRKTIPQMRVQQPVESLRTSTDTALCKSFRMTHYGHPAKGLDRIETSTRPCDGSRLAAP